MKLDEVLNVLKFTTAKEVVMVVPVETREALDRYCFDENLLNEVIEYGSFPLSGEDVGAMANFEAATGMKDDGNDHRKVHALDMGFSSLTAFGTTLHYTTFNQIKSI